MTPTPIRFRVVSTAQGTKPGRGVVADTDDTSEAEALYERFRNLFPRETFELVVDAVQAAAAVVPAAKKAGRAVKRTAKKAARGAKKVARKIRDLVS